MSATETTETIETITSKEQLADLPEYTVVVAAPQELDGHKVTLAVQKFGGEWFSPGYYGALTADDLTPAFFPAKVVFRL